MRALLNKSLLLGPPSLRCVHLVWLCPVKGMGVCITQQGAP